MKSRILRRETLIDRPREEVFDFFSKAENLNKITPPHLHFKTLTPAPILMKKGTLINYRLKLLGIPFSWQTEISHWEPPFKFIDSQLKGPYRKWIHQHTFIEKGSKTLMADEVEYVSPGWIFEPLIHKLFVHPNLETIFDYREENISEYFQG